MRKPKESKCYGFSNGETFYCEVDELVEFWTYFQWPDPVEYPTTLEIAIGYGTPKPMSEYCRGLPIGSLFEGACEVARECFDEDCDAWLDDVTEEQQKDLLNALDEWAERHGHAPRFFEIERTERAEIVILDNDGKWKWKEGEA